MINLAFGGKLVHGGVDEQSLLPRDVSCNILVPANSIGNALSDDRPSHAGALEFPCGGDDLRKFVIWRLQVGNNAAVTASPASNPAYGYPDFDKWPKWNDITHQKMWFEWIKRARDGGLRIMVALATNNKTLGDLVSGPGDLPTDDVASADLQIAEIKRFVARHNDFMELARNSSDIRRIVLANKIAVVLGVEIDDIGHFNRRSFSNLAAPIIVTQPVAEAELMISRAIQRLYDADVRYIFPVHVIDNAFGGTAIYQNGFNISNYRETGHYWDIECAELGDDIPHQYTQGSSDFFVRYFENLVPGALAFVKLGVGLFPGPAPVCPPSVQPLGQIKTFGHRNARGLTPLLGVIAIKEMMKRGMIIDVDHASEKSVNAMLDTAELFDYPLVSGHSSIRGMNGATAENSRSLSQLRRISKLQGMFGLGSDGAHAVEWVGLYQTALTAMGYQDIDPTRSNYQNGAVAFGTDLNGLVKGHQPGRGSTVSTSQPGPGPSDTIPLVKYDAGFPMSRSGNKEWDFNTEGVAHYGMLADFVKFMRAMPKRAAHYPGNPVALTPEMTGVELVDEHLSRSADYFWRMWVKIEARKANVR